MDINGCARICFCFLCFFCFIKVFLHKTLLLIVTASILINNVGYFIVFVLFSLCMCEARVTKVQGRLVPKSSEKAESCPNMLRGCICSVTFNFDGLVQDGCVPTGIEMGGCGHCPFSLQDLEHTTCYCTEAKPAEDVQTLSLSAVRISEEPHKKIKKHLFGHFKKAEVIFFFCVWEWHQLLFFFLLLF